MKNFHEDVRKMYVLANQNSMAFREKLEFSEKDLLQFSVDDASPSALLRFGTLLDNKYLGLQHDRGQNEEAVKFTLRFIPK